MTTKDLKIAIVHDSFTQLGGAERVVEVLHAMFPDAPVYTLVFDRRFLSKFQTWDIRATWLQRFYNLVPKLQYWLFLIPWAVSSIKIKDADIVISSSSGFVKNIRVPKTCVHINYCHTPARFLWLDADYVKQEAPFLLRPILKIFLKWMRQWDYRGAQRVDYFIVNSTEVQKRIASIYHRTSTVAHAGVDTEFWRPTAPKADYFLVAGRLQAHKKNDIIVEIFNELGLPLHVVGTGRQAVYLKSIAKPNIKFLGSISDEQLRDEYSGALAVIFPQVEDFGLVPLEAAACGTATIGIAKGGSLETIIPGVTGEFFGSDGVVSPFMGSAEPQTADLSANYTYDNQIKSQIRQMVLSWNPQKYKIDALRAQAEKFSQGKFKEQILEFLNAT